VTPLQLAAQLRRVGAGFTVALRKLAIVAAADAERFAKERTSGPVLHARTGRLRSSIGGSILQQGDDLEVHLSAGGTRAGREVPYAAAHEWGATIRPRNGAFLRIPLGPAKTAAGVDRFGGPLRTTGAGQFAVVATGGGRAVLMRTKGPGKGQAWYALVRSVTLPARPFLTPSVREAGDLLVPAATKELARLVGGAQ
jgi:phage gpG-like protein